MGNRIYSIGAVLLLGVLHAGSAFARTSADVSSALNVSALQAGKDAVVAVVVDVHSGLHAQSHTPLSDDLIKFEVKADDNPQVTFGDPIYPPGDIETYAALGKLSVYTGRVIIYLPVKVKSDAPLGAATLSGKLTFQACNENTCFAPEHPAFSIQTTIVAATEAVTPANADLFANMPETGPPATQPTTQPAMPAMTIGGGQTTVSLFGQSIDLNQHSVFLAALIAFMAGIIFNVVPCVLPVLPVKAVGFYEASQHSRARSLLLGFIFSLGLVAIFAALGMVVLLSKSLFGSQITWGQQFSYPWFVWSVAVILGALGFGMLGAFSVNLPTSIYGLDFRHDTLSGNFLWGCLTAVLSTPCTAPLFPPVLGFALTLPRIEGFLLVTTVGCGMASPYLLLSAFPEVARRFPRTGAFSELVKQMMGFLMLGSAAFFAGLELVGEPNQWWVVFAVAVWACLYLVARTSQIAKSSTALYISTAMAVAILGGALILTLRLTSAAASQVEWQPYSAQALADARANHRTVLIDFTANWCLNCKYVESTVYHDPRTLNALRHLAVVTLKADLTDHDAPGWDLRNQLGSEGIPYTAVYLPDATQPVGLASIYTTDTLLNVLNGGAGAPSEASLK
ncbi:MAG: thioredoxin family protein [Tepidisphaeraceae bacterium]|jgi:thiol:disulfide interchange protein DsbD